MVLLPTLKWSFQVRMVQSTDSDQQRDAKSASTKKHRTACWRSLRSCEMVSAFLKDGA